MSESKIVQAEQQVIVNVMHGQDTSLNPEDLQSGRHRVILKAALDLRDKGITPDLVTLNHKLTDEDLMNEAGGIAYLSDLYSEGLPTKNIEPYEEIVKEQRFLRDVKMFAKTLLHDMEEGASVDDIMARVQAEPLQFTQPSRSGGSITIQELVFDHVEQIKKRKLTKETTGVPTPWSSLNKKTLGLQKADLIIVAGRPSMGKSALAMQMATHCAKTTGPVFVTSMEMSAGSLIERVLASEGRVEATRMREGYLSPSEIGKIERAAEKLMDAKPIIINDSPRLTAQDIRLLATKEKIKRPDLSLIVVDYLGLIRTANLKQRYLEIAEATRTMKQTARELNIPVVLVCQLNRSCDARDDKRPLLSDLRESGDIEQDADVVIMVYRDEYYYGDKSEAKGQAELLIRKQRNGPIGMAKVAWTKNFTMFENLTYGGEYDEGRSETVVVGKGTRDNSGNEGRDHGYGDGESNDNDDSPQSELPW